MACDGCARRIQEAIEAINGVDSIEIILQSKQMIVTGTAPVNKIQYAITEVGYTSKKTI